MGNNPDLPDEQRAAELYKEYRDTVLRPAQPLPPKPWVRLDDLAGRPEPKEFRWWPAVALAAAASLMVFLLIPHDGEKASREVTQLLIRSAAAALPEARMISMRLGGRTLIRPAVMTAQTEIDATMEHLQSLFETANYSWREPLNARSFQDWRSSLKEKQDSVSVIHRSGQKRGYRVQTETSTGLLRRASLTLRLVDLRPTNGTFAFEGETTLEMSEAPATIEERQAPAATEPPRETPASAEDTLHVLAALNKIGADVGEPIDVSIDPAGRRVVVRADGLSAERKQQIEQVLEPLPRVAVEFDAGGPSTLPVQTPAQEQFTTSVPGPLQQQLESNFGGPAALQEVTDQVLEASALALARAHSVQVLAEKFPSGVETEFTAEDAELLHELRRRHVLELTRLVKQIRTELKPLLTPSNNPSGPLAQPWQSGVRELVEAAQEMDRLLNHLLAGSYSLAAGEEMLLRLAPAIERLERAADSLR